MRMHEHARELRRRLNDHSLDIEGLATQALDLFRAAKVDVLVHWLELELGGYGVATHPSSVHGILNVASGERLAVQVKMYRVQAGRLPNSPVTFHHFFGDPLAKLVDAQLYVRTQLPGTPSILLNFHLNHESPYLPTSGTFRSDTFDRILLGFRAVLHLQLGGVAT